VRLIASGCIEGLLVLKFDAMARTNPRSRSEVTMSTSPARSSSPASPRAAGVQLQTQPDLAGAPREEETRLEAEAVSSSSSAPHREGTSPCHCSTIAGYSIV
jgi:hypothetical protein